MLRTANCIQKSMCHLEKNIARVNLQISESMFIYVFNSIIGYNSLVLLEIVQFTPQIGQCCFKHCCKLPSAQQQLTSPGNEAFSYYYVLENIILITIKHTRSHEDRKLTFLCQLILRLFTHPFCMSATSEEFLDP